MLVKKTIWYSQASNSIKAVHLHFHSSSLISWQTQYKEISSPVEKGKGLWAPRGSIQLTTHLHLPAKVGFIMLGPLWSHSVLWPEHGWSAHERYDISTNQRGCLPVREVRSCLMDWNSQSLILQPLPNTITFSRAKLFCGSSLENGRSSLCYRHQMSLVIKCM